MGSDGSWRSKNHGYYSENTMKTEGKGEYDMKTNEGWRLERKGHGGRKTSAKTAETASAGPTVMRHVNG